MATATDGQVIHLNTRQQEAADHLNAMLSRPDVAETFLLLGYAGTGKTSTLASVLGDRKDVLFVTPSHAAKNVLKDAVGGAGEVVTIHSALGWRMHTTAEGTQYCAPGADAKLARAIGAGKRIIVLDECSMVGGAIFDALREQLGLIDGSGARTLIQRTIARDRLDGSAEHDRIIAWLFGQMRCPDTEQRVATRPARTADGDLSYWIEGARVPVKLVVMGDPGQLPPVGATHPASSRLWQLDPELAWCLARGLVRTFDRDGVLSRATTLDASPTLDVRQYGRAVQLTELMRADRSDLRVHNLEARQGAEQGWAYTIVEASRNVALVDAAGFLASAVSLYRAQEDAVVLVYRNAHRRVLNDKIREALLGPGKATTLLHIGEPCYTHAPVELRAAGERTGQRLDNGDLVYVKTRRPYDYPAEVLGMAIPCWAHHVERARDRAIGEVYWMEQRVARQVRALLDERRAEALAAIVALEGEITLAEAIGDKVQRDEAVARLLSAIAQQQQRIEALNTLQYDTFAQLEPSYVRTCHKAQGGSWATVLYDQEDVRSAGRDVRPKLAYVAISRARQHLIVRWGR